jgi:hypothetical protein
MSISWYQDTMIFLGRPVKSGWEIVQSLEGMDRSDNAKIRRILIKDRCYALCLPTLPTAGRPFPHLNGPNFFIKISKK